MPNTVEQMQTALRKVASASDARFLQRFFKTGAGEYGEGDRFLGVRVPATRAIVKQFPDVTLEDALQLLQSAWHEERLLALLLMVRLYTRGDAMQRAHVYDVYLTYTGYINNWDLVDSSAEHIVGSQLFGKSNAMRVLLKLAKSNALWERRIAMLSTFHFIKRMEFNVALIVATQLLHDRCDLIHKAVGWMLREIGKRDRTVLERFLAQHAEKMPRTALRYAIEKFPEATRKQYLSARKLTPN